MANFFDLSVALNADFYQYATGGWQEEQPPEARICALRPAPTSCADNNEKRINELFSGMTQQKAEPGSVEQKISDLYKMGPDLGAPERRGRRLIKAAAGRRNSPSATARS